MKRFGEISNQERLLEFVAGLLILGPDVDEADRFRLADRVGLTADSASRVFGKSAEAAAKAMERARKSAAPRKGGA